MSIPTKVIVPAVHKKFCLRIHAIAVSHTHTPNSWGWHTQRPSLFTSARKSWAG